MKPTSSKRKAPVPSDTPSKDSSSIMIMMTGSPIEENSPELPLTIQHTGLNIHDYSDANPSKDASTNTDDDVDDGEVHGPELDNLSMSQLHLGDELGVEVKTTPTGKYQTDKSHKGKQVARSSPGPQFGSFVQHGIESRVDDPFATSPYQLPHRRLGASVSVEVTPTSQRGASRTQGNWRSGNNGSGSGQSDSPTNLQVASVSNADSPDSREVVPGISAQNAQAFYSATACVFVANLSSVETERELEAAVLRIFREYGPVYVKIRRDTKNMPYAFCQYTRDEHALRAISDGRGKIIHGRPCRTERAKAHRTYFMCLKSGCKFSIDNAKALLDRLGSRVSDMWSPSAEDVRLHNLVPGVFVQFKYFDDGRDAQQAIRRENEYQLETTTNLFESPVRPVVTRNQVDQQHAQDYLNEYERDRNSIFVSNLPQGFTECQVREIFHPFGTILAVILHERPSQRNAGQLFLYGFVEYEDPMAAQRAIEAMNNSSLQGCVLKVTYKNSDHRNSRGPSYNSGSQNVSPTHTPQSVRTAEATVQPGEAIYNYGYPTPYGYGGYPTAQYGSPYPAYWPNSPQYLNSPYGGYAGSPTPAPYYSPYPYSVDMYGQYIPAMPYYAPYANQGVMNPTGAGEESVTPPMSTDSETNLAEEHS